MVSLLLLRRRVRSIRNLAKITRAMEMIATARMRRAQERMLAARPYAEKIKEMIGALASAIREPVHPLLERREVRRVGLVFISPDRGLCGGLHSNLNRFAASFLLQQEVPVSLVAVGKRGRDFMIRTGQDVRAEFTGLGYRPTLADTLPISRVVMEDFINGVYDKVYIIYARFVSPMVQRPSVMELLPVRPLEFERPPVEYIYEPGMREVLGALLPRYVEREIYYAVLESVASELAARMIAMRNATENANKLIEELTLLMNKVRQETITKEILDIIGGAAALGGR